MIRFLLVLPFLVSLSAQAQVNLAVDRPQQAQAFTGTATFGGWAISTSAIASVSFSVDGGTPIAAGYGGARPDVCAAFPNRPGCPNVGWNASLDTTTLTNGTHTLMLVAIDTAGHTQTQSVSFIAINVPAVKSIQSFSINPDGHLIATYSDSSTSDLGNVIGATGAAGPVGPQGPAGNSLTEVEECSPAIGLVNGVNTTFTLSHTPVGQAEFYLNGLYEPSSVYMSLANVITWPDVQSLLLGDSVCVVYSHQ